MRDDSDEPFRVVGFTETRVEADSLLRRHVTLSDLARSGNQWEAAQAVDAPYTFLDIPVTQGREGPPTGDRVILAMRGGQYTAVLYGKGAALASKQAVASAA